MNVVEATDLWFAGRNPPLGRPAGLTEDAMAPDYYDPLRYVVWVHPGRPNDELAPRTALHVTVKVRLREHLVDRMVRAGITPQRAAQFLDAGVLATLVTQPLPEVLSG